MFLGPFINIVKLGQALPFENKFLPRLIFALSVSTGSNGLSKVCTYVISVYENLTRFLHSIGDHGRFS